MPVINVPFRLIYAFNPQRDPFRPQDVQVRRRHHFLGSRRKHEQDVPPRIVPRSLCRSRSSAGGGAGGQKAEPLRPAQIGVVDMQRISSESLLGKSYAAQIDELKNEMTAERTKKQNELAQDRRRHQGAPGRPPEAGQRPLARGRRQEAAGDRAKDP